MSDFFLMGVCIKMEKHFNRHTADYLKRQAKKLKRELGITYTEALNKATVNAGYTGWRNFMNQSAQSNVKKSAKKKISLPIPAPSVVSYHIAFSQRKYYRPNIQMSILAHKQVGAILKQLKRATENNKRAANAIKDVAFQLDEWVQNEYTDRNELPDETFFDLYYGDNNTSVEIKPPEKRKTELQNLCRKVQRLLKSNYHDCSPVKKLLQKLDNAIEWIKVWPAAKKERVRNDKAITAGSIVHFKSNKKPAILISHNINNGSIVCFADNGPVTTGRETITVPKDQSRAISFKPMRLWMPYGKSSLSNGEEVLFNRDYIPLWTKRKNGTVVPASPNSRDGKKKDEFFFNDGSTPWSGNKKTQIRCLEALRVWNVENKPSKLVTLLPQVIATGDISLLRYR